ncbi:MAG: hypothetical protein P4M15_09325 [Alphaproteobacteria bacterium]|nr:hypothetical protein [Alphaproteobacteria bacterium]
MNERVPEQLDKILALADSSHDGEAAAAVRKARQILIRDGLSFGDLARAASRGGHLKSPGVFSFWAGHRDNLESEITHLRQQLEELQSQMQTQELQLDFWRRRSADLEQSQAHAHSESERWKKLARDTAEQLWDMGQSLKEGEFTAEAAMPVPEKKAG